MMFAQEAVNQYLEAVRRVYGKAYEAKMTVAEDGAGHVLVKFPDDIEGELVSLGHLELMTEQLLSEMPETRH